jgi:hypothetical protein
MPKFIEDTMFDGQSIRDTSAHTSPTISSSELPVKTLIYNNTLDQTVTLQLQASRDQVNFFNVGSSFDVASNVWGYQTCDTFFPYGRIIAQCGTAPTTGTVSVWCEKIGY